MFGVVEDSLATESVKVTSADSICGEGMRLHLDPPSLMALDLP